MKLRAFVAAPFSDTADRFYRDVLRQLSVPNHNVEVVRVDDRRSSVGIVTEIESMIQQCDMAIVDLTQANPNVLYETGLAHAWLGRERVLLLCSESFSEVPFDLAGNRILRYSTLPENIEQSRARVELALVEIIAEISKDTNTSYHSIECYDNRVVHPDGNCNTRIRRIVKPLGKLFAIEDNWALSMVAPADYTYKQPFNVKIEQIKNLPENCRVTVDHEAVRPTRAGWRFAFEPPIVSRSEHIDVTYTFDVNIGWQLNRKELTEAWMQQDVAGILKDFYGKGFASRDTFSYTKEFEFSVLFSGGIDVIAVELMIFDSGHRRKDLEAKYVDTGAFRFGKTDGQLQARLRCQNPGKCKHLIVWLPANIERQAPDTQGKTNQSH